VHVCASVFCFFKEFFFLEQVIFSMFVWVGNHTVQSMAKNHNQSVASAILLPAKSPKVDVALAMYLLLQKGLKFNFPGWDKYEHLSSFKRFLRVLFLNNSINPLLKLPVMEHNCKQLLRSLYFWKYFYF